MEHSDNAIHKIDILSSRLERNDGKLDQITAENHLIAISIARLEERLRSLSDDIEEQNAVNRSIKSTVISAVVVAIAGTIISMATLGLKLTVHPVDQPTMRSTSR
jgi:cytochrome c-type biogenesis protein CcmH/NrfG